MKTFFLEQNQNAGWVDRRLAEAAFLRIADYYAAPLDRYVSKRLRNHGVKTKTALSKVYFLRAPMSTALEPLKEGDTDWFQGFDYETIGGYAFNWNKI